MNLQSTSPLFPVRRIAAAVLALTLTPFAAAVHAGGGVITTPGPPPSTAFAALWLQAEGEARIASKGSLTGLMADNAVFEQQGFRLVDLEIAGHDEERRFVGLWHEIPAGSPSGGAHVAADLTLSELAAKVAAEEAANYKLSDLEVYVTAGGGLLAAAVFHRTPLRRSFVVRATEEELLEAKTQLEPAHRMIDLELSGGPCAIRYAAVWSEETAVPGPTVGVVQSWISLADLAGALSAGRHLADLELAQLGEGGSWLAAGLWQVSQVPEIVLFPVAWAEIEDRLETGYAEPVPPGSGDWLLSDLEILWHFDGEVPEGTLTLSHDGPMIPPSHGD
jgi:hypothetical protein